MGIETTKYVRKPFEVEAVQVTKENLEEVNEWCKGVIHNTDKGRYIKVDVARALNARQTMAFPGDWVLFAGTGFKVYTSKAFHKTFELKAVSDDNLTELRTVNVPASTPTDLGGGLDV